MRIRTGVVCLVLGLAMAWPGRSQNITTVAGNSTWGAVYNVTLDSAGNMYVPDFTKHVVYKVDRLGATTIVAGNGKAGYSGDGGLATNAQLSGPLGTAIAPDGTLYIADYNNDRIRKVAPNNIITTFVGGSGGFSGDGGPASAAKINGPFSMAMDAKGNLFFVDYVNLRVRKIAADGTISTVAGTGRNSKSGDGGPATSADSCPGWLALGPDGSVYFTDDGNATSPCYKRVRKVSPLGVITTVAGTGTSGFSGDGGPATAALLRSAEGVSIDAGGNIYISEGYGARIRKVDKGGIITTYAGTGTGGPAGDGGPAIQAQVNFPTGQAIDADGNIFFADTNNVKIRKITPPPLPTIDTTSNAVVPAFLGKTGFTSNSYLEIHGQNLATTTRTWAGGDFTGANAPTTVDNVKVTVNGIPAFVYYVSPTQININTPDDTANGSALIQVQNALGFSNTVSSTRARVAPALQSVPQFLVGGKQYVVAQTPDFKSFIGKPNLLQGVPFTPAKPGDSIIVYALGCGPTNPLTPAGVVASQNSALALPFRINIGGVQADVAFGGIAANTIGLYQFNVTIPNVQPGDQPIELIVDGVPNAQNLVITIGGQ
ncbi:MAG: hypothetical protein LAP38_06220 [Acidobacteriia bacterium]|nr:hypothetical protein [Terriglobia bacterium]